MDERDVLIQNFITNIVNEDKVLELGFVPDKCYTPKISLLIHSIDNLPIFNDTQKENINHMINKYRNAG